MNEAGSARDGTSAAGAAEAEIWHIAPLALLLSIALWVLIVLAASLGLGAF